MTVGCAARELTEEPAVIRDHPSVRGARPSPWLVSQVVANPVADQRLQYLLGEESRSETMCTTRLACCDLEGVEGRLKAVRNPTGVINRFTVSRFTRSPSPGMYMKSEFVVGVRKLRESVALRLEELGG